MDSHKIWRLVRNQLELLRESAPDGYAPVVDVYLSGRPEPMRLSHVETARDESFPWVFLAAETRPAEAETSPDEHLVFVPEDHIERIEVRFERSEREGGVFSLGYLHEAGAA